MLSMPVGSVRHFGLLRPLAPCACGCAEEDKAFVEFLTDEIKEEKKNQKHKFISKMSGDWELKVNRMKAKLFGKVARGDHCHFQHSPPTSDGEEESSQGQKAEDEEPELTSAPNFVAEVSKCNGKETLVPDGHYPEDEMDKKKLRVIFLCQES